jgi:DNA-directed RNA polymerase
MQEFTGIEYLKIDLANCFGLDRLEWNDRIHWVDDNEPALEKVHVHAKSPILYRKAVRAYREVQKGHATNHIMGLDATASGLQIMACMSGCYETAEAVNVVNAGARMDVYTDISDYMNKHPGIFVTRDICKPPIMTVFYGSTAEPKNVFGEGDALIVFYKALKERLSGAYELMGILQNYWNPNAEYHRWTLPDVHIAKVPVTQTVEKQLEIDEHDHMRFAYRATIISPAEYSRSLAANIVHSIDGWMVRQMVQAADAQGFWMAPIHDCFYASPKYMNQVRQNYVVLLQWIADNNLVESILSEITGRNVYYRKRSDTLSGYIRNAEYALS